MKKLIITQFLAIFLIGVVTIFAEQVHAASLLPEHPRLIFHKEDEKELLDYLSGKNYISELHRIIIEASDDLITQDPVAYEKTGKRLLPVSRTCLKRVVYLSYSYRLTKKMKYLKRAEKEMLAVAGFADWNPDHFLDVAEMTTALAIGYDWLYHDLNNTSRTSIENAIINKGLLPSKNREYNDWLDNTNNWNQVCNGGLSLGAMAVYEREPILAQEIVDRALNSLKIPLQEYEPDGAYPEGSTYWAYGTMYHVLFIDAYRTSFPQQRDDITGNGFMKSADFFLHVFGPNGSFNYSDCRTDMEFTPAIFWYARELKDRSILFNQGKLFDELMATGTLKVGKTSDDRFLPLIPIWASGFKTLPIDLPEVNSWSGGGKNPVSFHRSSWEDHGIYIGIKGGSPALSHAHMDLGSFVMDAEGVRWAMDLGKHDYNQLESSGLDIWNRKQDSDRWKVFRHNNFSHNTLTVNDGLQSVEANGTILSNNFSEQFRSTVLDITPAYEEQLKKAHRGIVIADNAYVIVRDELTTSDSPIKLRWVMVTHDSIQIVDQHTAIIRKDGKMLKFHIIEPQKVKIQTYATKPELPMEDENPGTVRLGFELTMEANEEMTFIIALIPGDQMIPDPIYTERLSDW